MRYRFLGSSGLLISRITLGTMTFGAAETPFNRVFEARP